MGGAAAAAAERFGTGVCFRLVRLSSETVVHISVLHKAAKLSPELVATGWEMGSYSHVACNMTRQHPVLFWEIVV